MQNKVVLLSAILACGSASILSDQNSKPVDDGLDTNQMRSPLFTQDILALPNLPDELRKRATDTELGCFTISGDDCADSIINFLACAADANSGECVLGAECVITLKECLPEVKLQARQDGGGSPFDPELYHRSPDDVEPTLSIMVDSDEVPLETRQDARISDEIQAAIPAEVRNAMLNNPDAAESLANEFSSGSKPQWFARLPASVTNYYATITPPPTMAGYVIKDTTDDPERQNLDNWVASIQYYKDLIASASQSAASESDYARRMSRAAEEKSKWASEERDGQLQTSAWEQSRLAASASTHAAAESSYAASASRTVSGQKARTGQGCTVDVQLAFGSSIIGAVVCLGLAFAL